MAKIQAQWEEEAIERFRVFLGEQRKTNYAITAREFPVDQVTNRNFDYQLQNENEEKIAVELFRLVDGGEELAKQRIWEEIIKHLKEQLLNRGIKGYFISVPAFLVKKKDIMPYVTQLTEDIEKAIKDKSDFEKFEYQGLEFHKITDLSTNYFSYHTPAKSINPPGTALNSFRNNLPKKDTQVAISGHERILLVLNWAIFVDGEDTVRALSNFDFTPYQNIDKIFFEERVGKFVLIFDREVFESIKKKQLAGKPSLTTLSLQNIRYRLGNKEKEMFEFVKTITLTQGGIGWLSDNGAKVNLVSYGEDLVNGGFLDDAMWIVEQLNNDLNPQPDGSNDVDDSTGESNLHIRALRGQDVNVITTVRGHLCWLMMKIVATNQPKYYTRIIEIISRYFNEVNLYIRIQACIPLEELWKRRRAVRNQDNSSFDWKDDERHVVRELVLNAVEINRHHPRVLEALLHILLSPLRDLNETEAEEVLKIFLDTKTDYVLDEVAPFLLYLNFFRKNDFTQEGNFNPERFSSILREQIKNGLPSIRSSLVWHFWKLLSDKVLPYEKIKEFLPLFLEGEYDRDVMSKFAISFREIVAVAPEDALSLFEKMTQLLEKYLQDDLGMGYQPYIVGTEETIPFFVKQPERLLSIVERLKNIWVKGLGIYIGDIQIIFGSYKLVEPTKREEVKKGLKTIYDEMKRIQPELPLVDWEQ